MPGYRSYAFFFVPYPIKPPTLSSVHKSKHVCTSLGAVTWLSTHLVNHFVLSFYFLHGTFSGNRKTFKKYLFSYYINQSFFLSFKLDLVTSNFLVHQSRHKYILEACMT